MSARDGKPCGVCGGNIWNKDRKCVKCKSDRDRAYRQNNQEKVAGMKRRYEQNNREKVSAAGKRWREENKERKAETDRQWALANKARREQIHKRWRDANTDKVAERSRRWREENPERAKQYRKDWILADPDRSRAKAHVRRARQRGNGGKYTAQEWRDLCNRYGNKCLRCGRTDLLLTVDHVKPLVLGGTNDIGNIQPLCKSCNSRKQGKHIDYRPDAGIARWIQAKLFG